MDNRPTSVILGDDGGRQTPLLFRAFLFDLGPWRAYLHHFVRSDPDMGLHDHPAWNAALILAGGYWERRFVGVGKGGVVFKERWIRPGRINVIDQHCFHRVVMKPGCTSWSLSLLNYSKAKGKRWGFLRNYSVVGRKIVLTYTFAFADPPRGGKWWENSVKGKYLDRETGEKL
jgi:hypothetical protein